MTRPPLDDPTYAPEHPPVNGEIPDVVAKWGVASQRRWFKRYEGQLKPVPYTTWALFYCSSESHLGLCCESCDEDDEYYGTWDPDLCCCRGIRSRVMSILPDPAGADDDATRAICERCGGGISRTGNIWLHANGLILCEPATRETYWPLRGRTGDAH